MNELNAQNYDALLKEKAATIEQLFSDVNTPKLHVFASPEKHFRMRAEFRIWHTGDTLNYVMFKKGEKNTPINIYEFPNASEIISRVMNPLLEAIQKQEILSHKLFQIDFLSTTTNQLLITLLYHKPLDESWETAATTLHDNFSKPTNLESFNDASNQTSIKSPIESLSIIGRARKQKIVINQDFVIENMRINEHLYQYQQVENSFTQPNAHICEQMLNWAVSNTKATANNGNGNNDLLELYCGNGNFTLPLSKNFNNVLATEVSKTSVKSAQYNIALNKIDNVNMVRLSSEELTQALNKTREFRRLANIDLDNYQFRAVFVDPPRAGLDDETLKLVSQFDMIIYISCNPSTLIENVKNLTQHTITEFALFDQFPFTDHIESGVILRKSKTFPAKE